MTLNKLINRKDINAFIIITMNPPSTAPPLAWENQTNIPKQALCLYAAPQPGPLPSSPPFLSPHSRLQNPHCLSTPHSSRFSPFQGKHKRKSLRWGGDDEDGGEGWEDKPAGMRKGTFFFHFQWKHWLSLRFRKSVKDQSCVIRRGWRIDPHIYIQLQDMKSRLPVGEIRSYLPDPRVKFHTNSKVWSVPFWPVLAQILK